MHRIILHHIPLTQPPIETSFYLNLNFPRNFFEKRNTKRSSHISTYFREIETSSYSFYFSTNPRCGGFRFARVCRTGRRREEGRAKVFAFRVEGILRSTRLDSKQIRSVGVMRYWAAYTSSTRARFRIARQFHTRKIPRASGQRPLHKH